MTRFLIIFALAFSFNAFSGFAPAIADGSAVGARSLSAPRAAGSHEVAVTAADGDTYIVANAMRAEVDGQPILLAQADAGSASPMTRPAEGSASTPADKLHDPSSSPAASWDDLKAAKKVGWPLVVFAALVMLSKLFARAGTKLAWLAAGKMPVIVGAIGALAASCYNAAADGGAWTATAFAGLVGLSHYLDAGGKASS